MRLPFPAIRRITVISFCVCILSPCSFPSGSKIFYAEFYAKLYTKIHAKPYTKVHAKHYSKRYTEVYVVLMSEFYSE